jgi:hypothetical protein
VSVLPFAQLGAQLPGHGQIPLAPVLHADHTAALVMVIVIYAGFAGGLVWALGMLARGHGPLPLILLAAGVVAANLEPLGDHVGLIVYAPNIPWFHYWVMGRRMPSFILVGESTYVAFGSFYAYQMLDRGRSFARVAFVSAVLVGIPEIIVEVLWHHWGMIAYYGHNPTRILGIPLYSMVENSTLLPVFGFMTLLAVRYLDGARRLWLLLIVPCVTIGYIVGISWPVYLAIQSSAAAPIVWAACLVTCVAALASGYAVLQSPPVRERRA